MTFRITHTTRYDYGHLASVNHNEAWLLPRSLPGQTCRHAEIAVEPAPAELREHTDYFGNRVAYFSVQRPHRRMTVTATSVIDVEPGSRPASGADLPWEEARAELARSARGLDTGSPPEGEAMRARLFVHGSRLCAPSPALADYAAVSFPAGVPLLAGAMDLMRRIHVDFEYVPEYTTVATPLVQLLADRRGVCQDFAHVAVGCLRALGLAARYVSGYLETLPPPGREKLRGADASHAWFSVYLPGRGWFDFDPTNDQVPGDQHITVAWGRDYADVTPLKGIVYGSGTNDMEVSVDVERRPD